jgi:hypothetical protein
MTIEEGDTVEVYNRSATVVRVLPEQVQVIFADGSPRKRPVDRAHVTSGGSL